MRLNWIDEDDVNYNQESPSVVRRRAKRLLAATKPYQEELISPELLRTLSRAVLGPLSNKTVREIAKLEIKSLIGCRFTALNRQKLCLGLAGGYRLARSGKVLGLFAPSYEAVDVLGRVETLEPADDDRKVLMTLRCCNGVFAGQTVRADFRLRSLQGWASLLGASNPRRRVHIRSLRLFLRLECVARVSRLDNTCQLDGISTTDRLSASNLRLTMSRIREFKPCPYGALDDCVRCGVGPNQCDRSCITTSTTYPIGIRK